MKAATLPGIRSRKMPPTRMHINEQDSPRHHFSQGRALEVQRPLSEYYDALFAAFGPQHWWPGETEFEVIVGEILTQKTSWRNAEHAIGNLRAEDLRSHAGIDKIPLTKLERLIRPSGYFLQKARSLKAFCQFLQAGYGGSLKDLFETLTAALREELRPIFGIGQETADSILLYAGQHPVCVVDAYARSLLSRHGRVGENAKYEDIRSMFEFRFAGDHQKSNEFHALKVSGEATAAPTFPYASTPGTLPGGRPLT